MTSTAPPRRLVMVGGGARSGKSAFAQAYAEHAGPTRVFLATAHAAAGDAEMDARIQRHRADRGDRFSTRDVKADLAAAVHEAATQAPVVLVDCLTLWLSGRLVDGEDESAIAARVEDLARVLGERPATIVLVTNEVGLGVVPATPLGRVFRDVAGRAHQRLASVCDEVYAAMLGMVVRLRPGPVEAYPAGEPPWDRRDNVLS